MTDESYTLVAHRGDAINHLENTLCAFDAAAHLGVRHVELDIQVTFDGIPVVLHDPNLKRTHSLNLDVRKHTLSALARHGIFDVSRYTCPVPRLVDFVEWMQHNPRMRVFAEIKKESLRVLGRQRVLHAIVDTLAPIAGRYTLISYDARVLAMAKSQRQPIGYVLPGLGRRYRSIAEKLAPFLLFADCRQILRRGGIWPEGCAWATFEVGDAATAQRLAALGVRYMETMNPALLLSGAA